MLQRYLTLEYFSFDAKKLRGALSYILYDLMVIECLEHVQATKAAVGHNDSIFIVRDACLKGARKRKNHKMSAKNKTENKKNKQKRQRTRAH